MSAGNISEGQRAFLLTPEQHELVAVVDAVAAAHSTPRASFDGGPAIDRALWNQLAELGVIGLTASGAGSIFDQLLIAERLGAVAAAVPVLSSSLAALVLADAGAPIGPELTDSLLSGQRVVLAALSASVGTALAVTATESGGRVTLSGSSNDLLEAAGAEVLLLAVEDDWFAVDCHADGVTLTDQPSLDQGQRLGSLVLHDAQAARLQVRDPNLATQIIEAALLFLAAQATGAADEALKRSVEYAKLRRQFGQPIGAFQAVKHKLVEMLLQLQNARSATYNAGWAVESDRGDRAMAVMMAKAVATESAVKVASEAIQVHGGIGNTWEHDCHLWLRRAKACELALGDPEFYYQRLADEVIGDEAESAGGSRGARTHAMIDAVGDAAFRHELVSWLDENLPAGWGTPAFRLPRDETERREFLRGWQASMADGRWVGIHWPVEFGGRGASLAQQITYHLELSERGVPPLPGHRGLTIVGPTLIRHGTPEQQQRFLPRLRAGQDLWAGGFSEPEAGSDLASLRTSGVVDGDSIVVTGQKIWTSQAQWCNWIYTLVRTAPGAAKHDGITVVLIPLDSPGITIRPIRRMSGAAEFNEVFFDEVRVPLTNIVGPLNEGWRVNRTTLSHEHSTLFVGAQVRYSRSLDDIVALSRKAVGYDGAKRCEDPLVRGRLARAWTTSQLLLIHGLRNLSNVQQGGSPGPEGSIMKVFGQEAERDQFELAIDIAGPAGLLDRRADGVLDRGKWVYGYLAARAATVGGGTTEIHKNKIGEEVLGLPRDARLDA